MEGRVLRLLLAPAGSSSSQGSRPGSGAGCLRPVRAGVPMACSAHWAALRVGPSSCGNECFLPPALKVAGFKPALRSHVIFQRSVKNSIFLSQFVFW